MKFWSGRRVFLTGHTGFKGSWLALWLERLGARVTGFSLEPPSTPSLFELAHVSSGIRGDVRDLSSLQRAMASASPEVVFHLAAQSLVRPSYADPAGTYATNVLGTANVLEAARQVPEIKAVLIITSDKCYENREQAQGYRESDRLGGHDPYSNSKACAELVTAAFRDSYGLRVASCRAGNVIGGGDWAHDRLVPDFVRAILEKRPVRIRHPDAVRPWQHVLEPLGAYLRLAERLATDGSYADAWNFGPDERDARSVKWLVERLTALWGEGARWELDGGAHPKEAGTLRLDIGKARAQLGWAPKWRVEAALEKTVEWYKAFASKADLRQLTLAQIAAYE